MLKVINIKENYLNRSKKGFKANNTDMQNDGGRSSRKEYQVDSNGYFIWKSEEKKTKK